MQNPQITFFPQGRYTNTYQFNDNASWMKGNHAMQMGVSWQRIHVNPYNYEGTVPTIGWGFSSAAPASAQLTSAMFPGGISAADLSSANTMLAMLTGTISSVSRQFQVKDQTSGYQPGISEQPELHAGHHLVVHPGQLAAEAHLHAARGPEVGVQQPGREDDNLGFLPLLNGQGYREVLADPGATISFVDGGLWKKDLNNFGPTVGFAWDLFGDGRTAVRGGYSLTFVNEEGVTVATNILGGNAGLATDAVLSNQYAKYGAGVPNIPTPTFLTTRTLADQMALSATAPMAIVDPEHPAAEGPPGQPRDLA